MAGVYPTRDQILEDLNILVNHWRYLRIYDCSAHAETLLDVIAREKLPLKVMLGMGLAAEVNNPNCPWGGVYEEEVLIRNRRHNDAELKRMIALARRFPRQVLALSIGNEASVAWNDHMVPLDRLVGFARTLRRKTRHPVTFCENYVPWAGQLDPLAEHLDLIGVHTYPVWEYKHIDEALAYTQQNYRDVKARFPDLPVVITEAGWTTRSNGRGIDPQNASETLQACYLRELAGWAEQEGVLTFIFEAFDEAWKGSPDPDEPEKHWGLYTEGRQPKLAVREGFIGAGR